MVGIVVVSHSYMLAEGLKQMAMELSRGGVRIASAGGVDEVILGTNADRIHQAIQEAYSEEGVIVLFDLGSALLSTQMAIEMLPMEQRERLRLSDAPLVEGTVVAAVESSIGNSLEEVFAAVGQTRLMNKCAG